MYIPEGYGTVFPYMMVEGAEALTVFLSRVFDANVQGKSVLPDGRVANIRIRIGTSTFMLSEAGEGAMPAKPGSYYIYVPDVDQAFKTALELGAQAIFEPTDMPYEDRQAGIYDPSGNAWWISHRLVETPYDAQ
ncbi:MAG: VOC family protein [Gammaproteobacteria bacterium]